MSETSLANEYELAEEAIKLMITNDWDECEKLLLKYNEQSPLLSFCYSFFSCAKALLMFEETELLKASKRIDKSQKLCKDSLKNDVITEKSLQKLIGKTQDQNEIAKHKGRLVTLQEEIASKTIMIADCKLFIALLTIVRQDLSAIISTGVLELRRAWKTYSTQQKKFYNLFKTLDTNAEKEYGSDPNTLVSETDENNNSNNIDNDDQETDTVGDEWVISEGGWSLCSVKRLLASASFGFGIVQLCFSFLPPNILKLMKFIGFDGDRHLALKALSFTSSSEDIRAPFADITLLFYSTLGRQLFGYSELEGHLPSTEIERILEKNFKKYENSSLFLLLKGKYFELVEKNLIKAEDNLKSMQTNASRIPELVTLSWYELGMLNLLKFELKQALDCFENFSLTSKWSISFNSLLLILLNGAISNHEKVSQLFKQLQKPSQMKNPIEVYAQKRLDFLRKVNSKLLKQKEFHEFLLVEMIYILGFLPFCAQDAFNTMLLVLDQQVEKSLVAIRTLLEASIHQEQGNIDFALQLFNEAMARDEKPMSISKYIQPYALYHLSNLYCQQNDLISALNSLEKCKSYKEYELEDRLQIQIRITKRLIDFKKSQMNLK